MALRQAAGGMGGGTGEDQLFWRSGQDRVAGQPGCGGEWPRPPEVRRTYRTA